MTCYKSRLTKDNSPVSDRLLGGGTSGVGGKPGEEAVGVRTGTVVKGDLVRVGGATLSSHRVVPSITE